MCGQAESQCWHVRWRRGFLQTKVAGFNLIIAKSPPFFKADQELLTNRVMHYSQATFSIIFHATTPHHQERGEGNTRSPFCLPTVLLFTHSASVFCAYGRCSPYSANIPHHTAHVNYPFIYNACPGLCVKTSGRWTRRIFSNTFLRIFPLVFAYFRKHLLYFLSELLPFDRSIQLKKTFLWSAKDKYGKIYFKLLLLLQRTLEGFTFSLLPRTSTSRTFSSLKTIKSTHRPKKWFLMRKGFFALPENN